MGYFLSITSKFAIDKLFVLLTLLFDLLSYLFASFFLFSFVFFYAWNNVCLTFLFAYSSECFTDIALTV